MAKAQPAELAKELMEAWPAYKAAGMDYQYLAPEDLYPQIRKLKKSSVFKVEETGQSVEGRPVYLVQAGQGSKRVLLWSQMHGDEPAATMALADIFIFLQANDRFNGLRQQILQQLDLYFIPMLNPDGAAVYERRNAMAIDLNRDALRLASPEAQILKQVSDSLQPAFGFNLHDQSRYYNVGNTAKSAAISFLAPAYNYEKEVNPVRENAMKLIAELNGVLQQLIPGHVGRYNDDFEPRAFGDNIQKWGTSTILVETGSHPLDTEKQFLRKVNFVLLLKALKSIAEESYAQASTEAYFAIPPNNRQLYDLVVRNVMVEIEGTNYPLDIAIRRDSFHAPDGRLTRYRSYIADLGDLSTCFAYRELDGSGMQAVPGKIYEQAYQQSDEAEQVPAEKVLGSGSTFVRTAQADRSLGYTTAPFNLVTGGKKPDSSIETGNHANFVLYKDGEPVYAVVNGYLVNMQHISETEGNRLVY